MNLPVLPWYAPTGLQFTCTASGDCCTGGHGFVWLSKSEIRCIAKHLKLSQKAFLAQYCRTVDGQISLNERRTPKGKYDCTFLTQLPGCTGRGCAIYPVRPTQCRTWPFWPENLTSQKAWNTAAKSCQGMNQGAHFSPERIHSLSTATDWPKDPPTSAPAPKKSPSKPKVSKSTKSSSSSSS